MAKSKQGLRVDLRKLSTSSCAQSHTSAHAQTLMRKCSAQGEAPGRLKQILLAPSDAKAATCQALLRFNECSCFPEAYYGQNSLLSQADSRLQEGRVTNLLMIV